MALKLTVLLFLIVAMPVIAQVDGTTGQVIEVCPGVGIQQRTPDFQPGGIILTTFDKSSIWVYNIDGDRRYPLPDTHPCGTNCRLSSDALWVTYMNAENSTYGKMRLDGTERSLLVNYAADVEWWNDNTLLVWTPGRLAYLQAIGSEDREYLDIEGVYSVQPGGKWGVLLEQNGDDFTRSLINLDLRNLPGIAEQRLLLDTYTSYFNAESWSPDGQWLAYVSQAAVDPVLNVTGGEIFGVRPGDTAPTQWTDLTGVYGAVRINGLTSRELSWSPDGSHIAFWVIKLTGADPASTTAEAKIHTLDINTGELRAYCGFTTTEHTPNPPRLIWSPDGTNLAFGGNVPADDKGYLLLALDTATGIFTELSNGIFPALGNADVIVWGLPPQ